MHLLTGDDAVLNWVKGTALRPVLSLLDDHEGARFTAEYAARLRAAYPRSSQGTWFPFRRIFFVACKP
jgi:trans-aconitate 2-methyltransferase